MAKETPEEAKPEKKKRGLLSYLPWILAVVLLPAAGWIGYQKFGKAAAHATAEESADSEESSGEVEEKSQGSEQKSVPAPPKMAVPLVPSKVMFIPKQKGKELTSDMIISTNSRTSQKIITRLADVKAQHFAMTQIFLSSKNTDALIRKLNATQPKLFESIEARIKQKSFKDTQAPGFRNLIRAEMLYECHRVLGSNVVQEVIIAEFVVQ